jgi:hypothetical protein
VAHVGAEHVPQPLVATLPDQVQVDLTEGGQPAVRVVHDVDALAVADGEPVVGGRTGHDAREQPGFVHLDERVALAAFADHMDLVGVRAQYPDDRALRMRVGTEHRVRVVVCSTE